jgi:AraC-like DNA-binding protein
MQENSFFLTNRHLRDLNPLIAGTHECDPGYGIQPAIRKYTLIHFVFRGKGTLFSQGNAYPVQAGQAFVIRQGEVANYRAHEEDPWYYCWIGFDGELAPVFDTLPPVITVSEEPFLRIIKAAEDASVMEYRMAAELFQLYSQLFSKAARHNPHVRQVKNYIRQAYMHPIRIEHIAAQLNLNRRYLSRIFKETTGISIQQYLLGVRMEEARSHLRRGYSVQECAHMVGYEDVSNFSKMFKKHFGKSPVYWAKEEKRRE